MARRASDTDGDEREPMDALLRELARMDSSPRIPHMPLTGTRLGRFVLHEELGRGGMGVVYRAHDEGLGRIVALKVLSTRWEGDLERRARFLREARAAAAVTHPNIVTVYDVGEEDGRIFIAMECVAGRSLRDIVGEGPLTVPVAFRLAKGILRGLAKAHAAGIIHRDLKPDNVMVGDDAEAKVLDFGLAKMRDVDRIDGPGANREATGQLPTRGDLLGTPGYLAPEQARGEPVATSADIFSFGVMFYEMLAGERPFNAPSAHGLLRAVSEDAPTPFHGRTPAVPDELAQIIFKCLAKAPRDRFESAREALAALDALRLNKSSDTPRWSVRRAALVAVAAITVIGIAMGARSQARHADAVPTTAAAIVEGAAITAHPPPRTDNPRAAAAYALALQQLRDGSIASAYDDLLGAVALDPALAAAHLRLALYGMVTTLTDRREHYAAAARFRSALTRRDEALVPVAEAYTWDVPEAKEARVRLEGAAAEFPDDAEILDLLGAALVDVGRVEEGRARMRRAAELDPRYAGARWRLAKSYVDLDENEDALKVLDECLRISPGAGSCLRVRAVVEMEHGQCDALDADARRLMAIDPNGRRSHEFLAVALAARGAPTQSVRTALDAMIALGTPRKGHAAREVADLGIALLDGDFARAEAAALTLSAVATEERSERVHSANTMALVDVYEERGEPEKALAVAEAFERTLPAWTLDAPWGVRLWLLFARHRLGRLGDARFRAAREALLEEVHVLLPSMYDSLAPYVYGSFARTPAEAHDAMAYLEEHPTRLKVGYSGFGVLGEAYLRAGRVRDALPLLRGAATACTVLPRLDDVAYRAPFFHVRANLLLGEALETSRGEARDVGAACGAYATVIDRWGGAKPKSVSAERARSRRAALGCDALK